MILASGFSGSVLNYVWNVDLLAWVAETQPTGGGGGPITNDGTFAKETGGNLATLVARTPALGQALAAASTPVVLTAAQVTALTPPAAIAGFALEAGHLATIDANLALIKAKTDNLDAALSTRTKPADQQHTIIDLGSQANILSSLGTVLDTGLNPTAAAGRALMVAARYSASEIGPGDGQTFVLQADARGRLRHVLMDAAGNTRGANVNAFNQLSVSVDATVLPTNAALASIQTNGLQKTQVIDGSGNVIGSTGNALDVNIKSSAALAVTGPLTDVQLRASAVPVVTNALVTHLVAAASTNAASIKGSAGTLMGVRVFNNAGYPIYVKFHNTAGVPTAGTGVIETVGVQAGTSVRFVLGRAYATGIGVTMVKGLTDADATVLAANDAVVDIFYV